jgi:transposase
VGQTLALAKPVFAISLSAIMRLKAHVRLKDGKEHRYWSIVESRRCERGEVVQQHLLYLGELNDSQKEAWTHCIEAIDGRGHQQRLALYPADREIPAHAASYGVQVRLDRMRLCRPRQWGACWLFTELWKLLGLDEFWQPRLPESREGTCWYHIFMTLCAYRLIDPGSEWKLHRLWYQQSAMADLLGEDFALAAKDNLYRCLDKLCEHKSELFVHLRQRWSDLFGASFDVLLYDLTSTYFECEPPQGKGGLRRFGYSRDKRSDCVQVVIALIVTPEGFPLSYEVLAGNTADNTTLKDFLKRIETLHGKARRIWVMDRGIPTEEVLEHMREAQDPPVQYLVGTPKGRLTQLEASLLDIPWQQARQEVRVKLLPQDKELYVCVESADRVHKERSMRLRRLGKLLDRLKELQEKRPSYDQLLLKLGAAKQQAGRVWSLVNITLPKDPGTKTKRRQRCDFSYKINRQRLRIARRHEGRYLLRSNLTDTDPARLWEFYLQLTHVEEAFKDLKGDLGVRPVYHQKDCRIQAHIMVAFVAYCLHVTLRARLRRHAPGLTVRQVLDHLRAIQMLDVHLPTTDGRELVLTRYTEPDKAQQMLLAQLQLTLPSQPPPKITGDVK